MAIRLPAPARSALCWAGCLLTLSVHLAAQIPAIPVGADFQVNGYTSGSQSRPDVAVDASGGFVVTWSTFESDGTDPASSVQARLFSSDGSPLGDALQVNSYTTGGQLLPTMSMAPGGEFTVVWSSATDSDPTGGTQGQRLGSDGSFLGDEFQVNSYTTGLQIETAISVGQDGRFVAVWRSTGSPGTDGTTNSVQARWFDVDGSPLGSQFQVNSYTTSDQSDAEVAMDGIGGFVIVWTSSGSYGTDSSMSSVQGQRFDSDGEMIGGEFQVNTYTTEDQLQPSVDAGPDGAFVVVWTSDGSDGTDSSSDSIRARLYGSDGAPQGGEFQVNTYTTGSQNNPSVAMESDGSFVVVWSSSGSYGTDADGTSVQASRFASDGTQIGSQFQVNTYTTGSQRQPTLDFSPEGNFVVTWYSYGSGGTDTSSYSIQVRRYLGTDLFADGFESGNTSAWSTTVN